MKMSCEGTVLHSQVCLPRQAGARIQKKEKILRNDLTEFRFMSYQIQDHGRSELIWWEWLWLGRVAHLRTSSTDELENDWADWIDQAIDFEKKLSSLLLPIETSVQVGFFLFPLSKPRFIPDHHSFIFIFISRWPTSHSNPINLERELEVTNVWVWVIDLTLISLTDLMGLPLGPRVRASSNGWWDS